MDIKITGHSTCSRRVRWIDESQFLGFYQAQKLFCKLIKNSKSLDSIKQALNWRKWHLQVDTVRIMKNRAVVCSEMAGDLPRSSLMKAFHESKERHAIMNGNRKSEVHMEEVKGRMERCGEEVRQESAKNTRFVLATSFHTRTHAVICASWKAAAQWLSSTLHHETIFNLIDSYGGIESCVLY